MASPIAVIGAGSWGTALAIHLARNNKNVNLWGRDDEQMRAMQKTHSNEQYLPGIIFPDKLHPFVELEPAIKMAQDILLAVPSHAFRTTLQLIKPFVTSNTRIVNAAKGLDSLQHQLLHEVVSDQLGDLPFAVLSGPSFAKEVVKDLPTAVTVATQSELFAADLMELFHSKTFRVYTSADVIGVELGGAMKNVLAIAAGIADGLGFGANTRSALITRGLAEMVRLGVAMGGKPQTFMGLSGLGDLILTCTDNQSRNRRLGLALGANKALDAALKEIAQVVEGINTALEIHHVAQKYKIDAPISEQIFRVLHKNVSPQKAVETLLAREPKTENWGWN